MNEILCRRTKYFYEDKLEDEEELMWHILVGFKMLDNLRKSEGRVKEPFPRESRKGKTSSKQSGKLEYFLMYSLCHVFFRDLRNLLWTKTTVFKEKKHSGKPWNYSIFWKESFIFSKCWYKFFWIYEQVPSQIWYFFQHIEKWVTTIKLVPNFRLLSNLISPNNECQILEFCQNVLLLNKWYFSQSHLQAS